MSWIEQSKEVMGDHTGPAHISEIADMIKERFPNTPDEKEKLTKKVGAVLAADVKKIGAKASFTRVKGKYGKHKKGFYKLKKRPNIKPTPTPAPRVSNLFTGTAGASAVC